ncbi:hypothetical protein BGX23_006835 [Mortierella sp. AD031]|nr:hypothetical protein BGX23_006835 [Mortierella sp. AD031]
MVLVLYSAVKAVGENDTSHRNSRESTTPKPYHRTNATYNPGQREKSGVQSSCYVRTIFANANPFLPSNGEESLTKTRSPGTEIIARLTTIRGATEQGRAPDLIVERDRLAKKQQLVEQVNHLASVSKKTAVDLGIPVIANSWLNRVVTLSKQGVPFEPKQVRTQVIQCVNIHQTEVQPNHDRIADRDPAEMEDVNLDSASSNAPADKYMEVTASITGMVWPCLEGLGDWLYEGTEGDMDERTRIVVQFRAEVYGHYSDQVTHVMYRGKSTLPLLRLLRGAKATIIRVV